MQLKIEDLLILGEFNFEPPSKIFGHLKNYCYFLVLDDLSQQNSLLGLKKNNFLNNLIIKHRHYQINLIMTAQQQKYIPPIIRTIWTLSRCLKPPQPKS
jgi:hypothetical protein